MPARGYSSTPAKRRPEPRRKPAPRPSVPPGERAAGNAAARRNAAAAQRSEVRLRSQVQRERRKVKRGTSSLRADTRDVTRNTAAPTKAEQQRALAAALAASARSVGATARGAQLTPVRGRSFRETLDRELSGHGALAAALKSVAHFAGERSVGVGTGGGPVGAYQAHMAKKGGGGLPLAASVARPYHVKDVPEFRAAVEDAINFPAVAIPSLYVPAAAAVEAAHGDTRRARQLGKDIDEGDPLYNLLVGRPRKALKLAREHPGFTALEVFGAKGGLGRGAGRTVRGTGRVTAAAGRATRSPRTVARGERIRRVGAVETRPDARVPGTALRERREYSRDLINKGVQVRRDKARAARAAKLRARANAVADSDSVLATRLRKRANEVDPRVMTDKQVRARENLREARNENLRRGDVGKIDAQASKIIKSAGDKGAAPVLVASGITRASVKDLVKYRAELTDAHAALKDPGKRAANVQLRKAIGESIKTAERGKDPDLRRVLAAADRWSREIDKPLDGVLDEMGLLPKARGEKAKLIPFAAREMGARQDVADPLKDADQAARSRVRQARAQRARAERAVVTAGRRAAKEQGAVTARVSAVDRKLLNRDEEYRDAARDLGRAGVEYRKARTAHRNAHRNEGLWSADERRAIERRAARAEQEFKAAKANFTAVREEAVKRVETTIGTRPSRSLARLEKAQARVLETERDRIRAREAVKAAKADAAQVKVRRREERGPAIVGPDGRKLTAAEIRARVVAEREVDPSYVSQAPNARGPGAYYRSSASEPSVGARARTEKPTREGTFDASPEMLRARAMKAQGLVTTAKNFRAFIGETGVRGKDGKVRTDLTRAQGELAKRALEAERGLEFELVSVRPWAATRQHVQALEDAINAGGDFDPRAVKAFRDSLGDALEGKGDGPFALVPRAAAKQARQHLRVLDPTDAGKIARGLRSSFTRTVLTTSPGPTFGNLVEPGVRSAVMRAGPVSAVRGRGVGKALKEMDPDAYERLVATVGRGKVTLASHRRYVDPEQFDQGFTRKFVASWQATKRARGVNRLVQAWDMWSHLVFEQVNGRAEAFYRQGPMLGKVLKDSGLMDHTLVGLSKHAMREAAKGLRDTPTQAMVGKKLNDAYGKYQGFSPSGRKVIAEYTPFAAWWMSSATFIFKVLPRDHPVLVGLTAAMEQATEEWRKAQGLDLFMGKGRLPGFLQGTVPAGKHGRVKVAYNTPAGAFTDPLESASSLVFPQGENLLKAFQGLDWKNKRLRNADGSEYDELQKALYAAGEVLKSTVPAVAVPSKVGRYAKNPRSLLNPVLVPPRKGASSGSTEGLSPTMKRRLERVQREAGAGSEREAFLQRRLERLTR